MDSTDLIRAKLAEKAERYPDMLDFMKKYTSTVKRLVLTPEERNLLSVAYKNIVGDRRSAWKVVRHKVKSSTGEDQQLAEGYLEVIRKELDDICKDAIEFIDKIWNVCPQEDVEGKVFYLKMKGDYLRYECEYTEDDAIIEKSLKAYKAAEECGETLDATHPIKLGLALNFSVFYYEIKKDQVQACKTAKDAFDKAINMLDSMSEEHYKDSTLIMQLLRDNLTLWTSSDGDEEGSQ